jgi:hypothetical protein
VSVDIIVLRGAGDKRGPDIIEPLIAEPIVAVERGRNELDTHSVLQQPIQMTTTFRTGVELGQLVEVIDALQGEVWRGKITGISHRISGGEVQTTLDILRPAKFF